MIDQALLDKFQKWLDYEDYGVPSTDYIESEELEELFDHFMNYSDYGLARRVIDYGHLVHPTDEVFTSLQIEYYLATHEPHKALQLLRQLSTNDDPALLAYYVSCYAQLGNKKKALDFADLIYRLADFDPARDNYEIGVSFNEADMHDTALHYFLEADKHETSVDTYIAIANCYLALEQSEKAVVYANKATMLDPYSLEAWHCCIYANGEAGNFDEAQRAADYYLAIDDTNMKVKALKLAALLSQEKIQQANEFSRQITKNADCETIAEVASIYMSFGLTDTAYALFDSLTEEQIQQIENVNILESYVDCLFSKQQETRVISFLESHPDLLVDNPPLIVLLADAYIAKDEIDKAMELCRKNTEHYLVRLMYGNLLNETGNASLTLGLLHDDLKKSQDPRLFIIMANAAWKCNDLAAARRYFNKAMRLNKTMTMEIAPYVNEDMVNFFSKNKS